MKDAPEQNHCVILTVDLEGGWAYPLDRLHPEAPLTRRLCRELNNTQRIISHIPVAKQRAVCFAFVFNGLIESKIEEKVAGYTSAYGLHFRELAISLFDLRSVKDWLISNTFVSLGYHSFDHLSYEFMNEKDLTKDLFQARMFLQKNKKEHPTVNFINLMVFPMNIKPQADLSEFKEWIFRVGIEKNPQSTSLLKNSLNYLRKDFHGGNCIHTQTYYPLGTSGKNLILRALQRFRYSVGLGKYIWIHAWELDDEYYLRGLLVYL
jgi:hypothetical protein